MPVMNTKCLRLTCGLLMYVCSPSLLMAQKQVEVEKSIDYKQPVTPMGADNYKFSTYYYNGKKSYNMMGFTVNTTDSIRSLKLSPAGSAYALMTRTKKRGIVEICNPWEMEGPNMHTINYPSMPTAICYSADSRRFFVANEQQYIRVYETTGYQAQTQWNAGITPQRLAASPNGYFVAAAGGSQVVVINQETGAVRTTITLSGAINDIAFSEDSGFLGVLSADGRLTVYDTRSFQAVNEYTQLGQARSLSFHPDGKYIAVLVSDREIVLVNMSDDERLALSDEEGGANYVRFLKDDKKKVYLSYNTKGAVKYKMLKGLRPNMRKYLMSELTARMDEWAKMRPGESMSDYQNRVNEDSRLKQARLFEQQIATELAGAMVMEATVTLGNYNPETNVLTIEFSNMPQIYLNVPTDEVASFANASDLEFSDVVYGMTMDEKFEVIYAKVHNKATGKAYVFDNLERQSLDYLTIDDNFVPIELVQQSSMDDVKLQGIMEDVVGKARQDNLISNHTNIEVRSTVVSDVDADGRKITNYKVNFNYTVEGSYSVKEDFAAGRYKIEESNAAVSMLTIVTRAFEKDFAQYIKPGKKVIVKVTGSADALKINGTIAYDGSYGNYTSEPYYLNDVINSLTVTRQTGIKKNEQLAFMRAVGVKDYISRHVPDLQKMQAEYQYHIELAEGKGSQFRRINVEFIFVDAFNNQ